jgi:hypothetical protein
MSGWPFGMNCESFLHPPSYCIPNTQSRRFTSRPPPFSALTNNMDYDDSTSSSSHNYGDFYALAYPQAISPEDETCASLMDQHHGCNDATYEPIPISALSPPHFSGMFDPDSFDNYYTNFFHPDTPSSASSASEIMTPISSRGEIEFPAIASGSGGDVDMDACPGDQILYDRGAASIPLDFSELLLETSKSTSDDAPVDWPELLAAMCAEHPEAVQWFAEMGGFQHNFDHIHVDAPPHEHDFVMQSQFSTICPHRHHHNTLPDFMLSLNNPPSNSPAAPLPSYPLNPPSIPIPLHHPRPVRPIPQIPLKDLAAAAALRLEKSRGVRESTKCLPSFPLLCRPVADAVRYQRKPFSATGVNADR